MESIKSSILNTLNNVGAHNRFLISQLSERVELTGYARLFRIRNGLEI